MRPSIRTRLLSAVLLLICWTGVHAQFELGPSQLLDPPAPTLEGPRHIRIRLRSSGFVGKVGGVAFGGTAEPSPSTTFKSLSLSYRPQEKDGRRLWVTVDGRQFPAQIYDWQMIPIARFADSPYKSCVTLFGELKSSTETKKYRDNGDTVINYHPAFVNNLLGLRIFQLDILIGHHEAVYLPAQKGGTYVLGEGETQPDLEANEKGWKAVRNLQWRLRLELKARPGSYVITDDGRDIQFDFDGGSLRIAGEPYIYFWRYKGKTPDYSLVDAYVKAALDVGAGADASPPAERRKAYAKLLLDELNQTDVEYDTPLVTSTLRTLLDKKDDQARAAYIETLSTDAIRDTAIDLRVLDDVRTVVPLKEYTERMSSDTNLLRSINPAVWDAGVEVMRYAAFFRYVKANYPAQWDGFTAQLGQVPVVNTPTVFKRSRN